jgi:hypothetical protein
MPFDLVVEKKQENSKSFVDQPITKRVVWFYQQGETK